MSRWCKKCGRELPVGIENEAQYIISETVSRCEFCSGRYAKTPLAKKKNFGVMFKGKKRKGGKRR